MMHWKLWLVVALVVLVFVIWALRKRLYLMSKYENDKLVENLMDETFWRGQTAEQLRDSLGEPLDIDQKVMKTKVQEIWKYEQTGKNRYSLKIKLDDGIVVGWDQK